MNLRGLLLLAALALVGYLVVDEVARRVQPALRRQGISVEVPSAYRRVSWRAYLPLPIAVALAVLFARPLKPIPQTTMGIAGLPGVSGGGVASGSAPFPIIIVAAIILLGLLVTIYQLRQAEVGKEVQLDKQAGQLVRSFASTYELKPSIFSALEEAKDRVDEPVRSLVDVTIRAYYITDSQERAFAEWRKRTENPYLHQFVYVLERSAGAEKKTVLEALDDLAERIRRREELRRNAESNLAVITGQVRFIQILSVLIVFAIAWLDPLRRVYVSSWSSQLFFVLVAGVGAVTSYLIDRQVTSLRRRTL